MSINLMYQYILEEKELLLNNIETKDDFIKTIALKIKKDIKHVYIIGSGTSYHTGLAAKNFMEKTSNWTVDCLAPTHFLQSTQVNPEESIVIGISQSGKSISTLDGLRKAIDNGFYTIAMSEYSNSDLSNIADSFVPIRVGEREQSGAKTKGYVAAVLNLIMLSLEYSHQHSIINKRTYIKQLTNIKKSIQNMNLIFDKSEVWVQKVKSDFKKANNIMIVGYGANYATALEGGLKLLETVRIPVSGYEMEEFMHGIYNCINEDSFLIFLQGPDALKEEENIKRINLLKDFLNKVTDNCFLIGKGENISKNNLKIDFVNDNLLSVFEYIIPLQLLSAVVSNEKNINPDNSKFPTFHQQMKSKL